MAIRASARKRSPGPGQLEAASGSAVPARGLANPLRPEVEPSPHGAVTRLARPTALRKGARQGREEAAEGVVGARLVDVVQLAARRTVRLVAAGPRACGEGTQLRPRGQIIPVARLATADEGPGASQVVHDVASALLAGPPLPTQTALLACGHGGPADVTARLTASPAAVVPKAESSSPRPPGCRVAQAGVLAVRLARGQGRQGLARLAAFRRLLAGVSAARAGVVPRAEAPARRQRPAVVARKSSTVTPARTGLRRAVAAGDAEQVVPEVGPLPAAVEAARPVPLGRRREVVAVVAAALRRERPNAGLVAGPSAALVCSSQDAVPKAAVAAAVVLVVVLGAKARPVHARPDEADAELLQTKRVVLGGRQARPGLVPRYGPIIPPEVADGGDLVRPRVAARPKAGVFVPRRVVDGQAVAGPNPSGRTRLRRVLVAEPVAQHALVAFAPPGKPTEPTSVLVARRLDDEALKAARARATPLVLLVPELVVLHGRIQRLLAAVLGATAAVPRTRRRVLTPRTCPLLAVPDGLRPRAVAGTEAVPSVAVLRAAATAKRRAVARRPPAVNRQAVLRHALRVAEAVVAPNPASLDVGHAIDAQADGRAARRALHDERALRPPARAIEAQLRRLAASRRAVSDVRRPNAAPDVPNTGHAAPDGPSRVAVRPGVPLVGALSRPRAARRTLAVQEAQRRVRRCVGALEAMARAVGQGLGRQA